MQCMPLPCHVQFRRQGVARALMRICDEATQVAGLPEIYLHVRQVGAMYGNGTRKRCPLQGVSFFLICMELLSGPCCWIELTLVFLSHYLLPGRQRGV